MPEHRTDPWWRMWVRCWRFTLAALVVGVLVGYCAFAPVAPEGNTCGWPETPCEKIEGNPTARVVLDGLLARAQEALEKGHIDQGMLNEIVYLVEEAKRDDCHNDACAHVCQLNGPTGCEELATISSWVDEASQAPTPEEGRPLWERVVVGLRDFPSGQ